MRHRSSIPLLVGILLLQSFDGFGHPHQYHGWVRVPTISPVPTETAVPSPSPSEVPSYHPSDSPSISLNPTSSLQPSTSPTTSPTNQPSQAPTSLPSSSPSFLPSLSPSLSLAPTITASPTGPIFMAAKDVRVMFQGVARQMETTHIESFEDETKLYLQQNLHHAPAVLEIEIEAVTVTNQKLVGARRRQLEDINLQQPQALEVTMQVVASVLVDRNSDEHFDLKLYLEIFFENYDNLQGLRQVLEQQDEFAQEIFWNPAMSAENNSRSIGGSIAGTVFGVAVSFIGFAGIWMWSRKRRHQEQPLHEDKQPDHLNQLTFTHTYDTDDCLPPTNGGLPAKEELDEENEDNERIVDRKLVDGGVDDDESRQSERDLDVEESMSSMVKPPPHLMYTPALMTTESNIEVPDSPQTAFFTLHGATSSLTTPAAGGTKPAHSLSARPLLATPKLPPSTKDETETVSSKEADVSKKKSLLPRRWKTPFRRNASKSRDDEDDDDDEEESNVDEDNSDVVAFPSARKSKKQQVRYEAAHPPMEIGGPEIVPSLMPSTTTITNDDSVGIVDEVAYMYSTNGGGAEG